MQTIIRQASIDDKMAIWDFIEEAYEDAAKYKIPTRWNWQFLENPLVDKSGKELPIFIAIKGDHIVGQLCAILGQIKIGAEIHRVAASCDLVVLPECRGEGIAQRLIQAVAENYEIYYTISCSEPTMRIFDRIEHLGYHKLELVPTYRRFVKLNREFIFRYLMQKTVKHSWMRSVAKFGCLLRSDSMMSVVGNFLIGIRDLLESQTKTESRSEIKEIQWFGDEIDQLWKAASGKFKIIVKRDQQFLNWRFSNNTQLDYRSFISRRNGETRGYIVLRKPEPTELNVGIIVDLFAAPDDNETIEDLIRHAIDFFGKSVFAIDCPTSLKEYQRALSKLGFYKIEKTGPIYFCADSKLRNKLEECKNSWFLTKADQDWDQLRPI
ncbi:MAG: GNAT family N-acetyltransferase [Syntrophales bacterium]